MKPNPLKAQDYFSHIDVLSSGTQYIEDYDADQRGTDKPGKVVR